MRRFTFKVEVLNTEGGVSSSYKRLVFPSGIVSNWCQASQFHILKELRILGLR